MSVGLSTQTLIDGTVNLSPNAAQYDNFDSLVAIGSSSVIDVTQRLRSYNSLSSVGADFGTSAPEYLAAEAFFFQTPRPSQLYIGRWAQSATSGLLRGGILSKNEQALAAWHAITTGSMHITVDGGAQQTLNGLAFATVTNMNGVATVINGELSGAVCIWNGQQFIVTSNSTGAASTVIYATATGTGVDVSALLKMTAATASGLVNGIVAESLLTAVTIIDALPTKVYGMVAVSPFAVDSDHEAIAAFIEATNHVYGITTTETAVYDGTVTTDLASVLKASGYKRSFVQYSENPYAVCSWFGRAFTVNFNANNSVITMMYKQEPGIAPETLTDAQAAVLTSKNCNVFVNYDNGTAILQNGIMSGGVYFDEIHCADWLQNRIQTDVFNLLYVNPTKIPQTDGGNHQIVTVIESSCDAGVNNGAIGEGLTWNFGGFGQLSQGQVLPKGYYVYAPPISTQSQADRAARKSVSIQVAATFAGAIHTVAILINVNR